MLLLYFVTTLVLFEVLSAALCHKTKKQTVNIRRQIESSTQAKVNVHKISTTYIFYVFFRYLQQHSRESMLNKSLNDW